MEAVGGILFLLILLGASVLWIWALVDAVRTPEDRFRAGTRLVWVVVIAVTHLVGALIYLALGRPRRPERALA